MVRGRHKEQAERRRDWAGVEAERDAALLRARRAAEERDRALANADVSVAALQAEIRTLRTHIAEQTSPALVQTLRVAEENRKKCEHLDRRLRQLSEVRIKTEDRLVAVISSTFGLSIREAGDLVMGAVAAVAPTDGWGGKYLAKGGGLAKIDKRFDPKSDLSSAERRAMSPRGVALDRARGLRTTEVDFARFGVDPDVWIVHDGDCSPRVLIAMYGSKEAADEHAADHPGLAVEGWYLQFSYRADDD